MKVFFTTLYDQEMARADEVHTLRYWQDLHQELDLHLLLGSAHRSSLDRAQVFLQQFGVPPDRITAVLCPFAYRECMECPDTRPKGDYQFGRRAHEIAYCKRFIQQLLCSEPQFRGAVELFVDSDTFIPKAHILAGLNRVEQAKKPVSVTYPCCLRGQLLAPDVQYAAYAIKTENLDPGAVLRMYRTAQVGGQVARHGAPDGALKRHLRAAGVKHIWMKKCVSYHYNMMPADGTGPAEGIYTYENGKCYLTEAGGEQMRRNVLEIVQNRKEIYENGSGNHNLQEGAVLPAGVRQSAEPSGG